MPLSERVHTMGRKRTEDKQPSSEEHEVCYQWEGSGMDEQSLSVVSGGLGLIACLHSSTTSERHCQVSNKQNSR
jgi:hypothetical protein